MSEIDNLTDIERRWKANDWDDPRPSCPNRAEHAVVKYDGRWKEPDFLARGGANWPKLEGKSVRTTHEQTMCPGCRRFVIWTPRKGE